MPGMPCMPCAMAASACGISQAPGTVTSRTSSAATPWRRRQSAAPAISASPMGWLNREATMPKRRPAPARSPRVSPMPFIPRS